AHFQGRLNWFWNFWWGGYLKSSQRSPHESLVFIDAGWIGPCGLGEADSRGAGEVTAAGRACGRFRETYQAAAGGELPAMPWARQGEGRFCDRRPGAVCDRRGFRSRGDSREQRGEPGGGVGLWIGSGQHHAAEGIQTDGGGGWFVAALDR